MNTVPASPRAAAQAEKVRTPLLTEVDAGRQPKTAATVAHRMERYLEIARVEPSTRQGYEGLVRNHIVPLLLAPLTNQQSNSASESASSSTMPHRSGLNLMPTR